MSGRAAACRAWLRRRRVTFHRVAAQDVRKKKKTRNKTKKKPDDASFIYFFISLSLSARAALLCTRRHCPQVPIVRRRTGAPTPKIRRRTETGFRRRVGARVSHRRGTPSPARPSIGRRYGPIGHRQVCAFSAAMPVWAHSRPLLRATDRVLCVCVIPYLWDPRPPEFSERWWNARKWWFYTQWRNIVFVFFYFGWRGEGM